MSTKIKLLPEPVANQIAAGEVVERPASVVKELLENSLDAGAGKVLIEVEQGGRRLVRVVDDGCGMSREDALLSLERHATSKISLASDLFSVRTLGFRGEAIPSIASVSEFTLLSRESESDAGVRVQVEAGVIRAVAEVGIPVGTEVVVRRLFFNVPARRKFLKTVETELGHVNTLVSNMALARPDAHLTLVHNGRTLFDLPASGDLTGRLRHALGADVLANLLPVDRTFADLPEAGPLRVHGFISVPSYHRSSTQSLHAFVNRRFVRDRLINHAVFEAYRTLIPRGRYPLVVLFLDLPPEGVDVNVHPAKHEIRFREQALVHQALLEAIQETLREGDRLGYQPSLKAGPRPGPESGRTGAAAAGSSDDLGLPAASDPGRGRYPGPGNDPGLMKGVSDALRRYHERQGKNPAGLGPGPGLGREGRRTWGPGHFPAGPSAPRSAPLPAPADREDERLSGLRFSELRVIGQAAGTYLLAEAPDSLVVIDQHAAHERIMFERLRSQFREEEVLRQPLLFPATVELTLEEAGKVEANAEALLRLGFEVEPFGGGTVAVKALPAALAGVDPARLLLEVVDRLGEGRPAAGLEEKWDEVFAVLACHSVVRAHERLTTEEIQSLLAAMDKLDFPGHCPHGRDVVIRIRFQELDKWFGR